MVTGSADGAFGMLSPFFDVCVLPFSLTDLSSPMGQLCNSVSTTPANGDGLWLGHRQQLGAQQHLGGTDSVTIQA